MIRRLSIISGLIIFAFVTTHLVNLSLGIVSLELLENSRPYFFALWDFPPFELLLVFAFFCHIFLALRALYFRNTLRMSAPDLLQLASALIILPLLIPHVVAIKVAAITFSIHANYHDTLSVMWLHKPFEGLRQVLLVMAVWIHGCLGLFTWLRLKIWWKPIALYCYPLAVIIPTLALLGFVEAGRDAVQLQQTNNAASADTRLINIYQDKSSSYSQGRLSIDSMPQTKPDLVALPPSTTPSKTSSINSDQQVIIQRLDQIKTNCLIVYLTVLALVFIARLLRLRNTNAQLEIHFADERIVTTQTGPNLLEIAIANEIPHANLCHGKGRCGTCRVRITQSSCELSTPTPLEQAMLKKLNSDVDTRLACQTFAAAGVLHLESLVPATVQPDNLHQASQATQPSSADNSEVAS